MRTLIPAASTPTTAESLGRRLIDVKVVAERLDCSWRTVLRLADRGAIPPGIKLGGTLRRWDAAELDAFIASGCKPPKGGRR